MKAGIVLALRLGGMQAGDDVDALARKSIFALTPAERAVVNDATAVERRREMGLLGITALRPGRNGMDMSAPNAVNYDEAKAEPRPIVSDVLAGAATADAWWHERRPALVGTFEKEMRSEEHTSELQSLMRISYAVFCLKKQNI